MPQGIADPDHPILAEPWTYRIVAFHWRVRTDELDVADIDLTLQRGAATVSLCFLDVSDVWIEEGFPFPTEGLCILDISKRAWERKRIEVTDFEACRGAIHFYADTVSRIA